MEGSAAGWEELFVNRVRDIGLIHIHTETSQNSPERSKQDNQEMGNRHGQTFHQKGRKDTNEPVSRPTPGTLATRYAQVKTKVAYDAAPARTVTTDTGTRPRTSRAQIAGPNAKRCGRSGR